MINFFTAPVVEGAQQAAETAAQAPVAAEAAPQAEEVVAVAAQNGVMGGNWSFWVMIIAMIAIMYFFMWRPEKKRRQEMQNFRDGLKAGDKVITAGGIYAVVKKVEETSLLIEVDSNVTLRIDKNMVVAAPSAPEK
jgi:preprotein translocase subunit YajC